MIVSKSLKSYVQLKKFNKTEKTYTCRVIDSDKQLELPQDDFTKYITVNIAFLTPISEESDQLHLKVNINDKVSKINDMYWVLEKKTGYIIHNGNKVSSDMTF